MTAPTLPRPAVPPPVSVVYAPGGDTTTRPQAASVAPPTDTPPGGAQDTQPAMLAALPAYAAPAGVTVAQPTGRHAHLDAHSPSVVGSDAGQDPAASGDPAPKVDSLLDPALALAADVLDDTERVLLANQNRLRQLTRSTEDKDGEIRGLGLDERHPDVARLAAIVDLLDKVTKDATKNLEKHMRRHPLHAWAKSMRGVGDKQIARLLAAIGDPYIRPEIVRDDGTVIPSGPRTVSALWAYCGYHVLPASGQTICDAHRVAAAGRGQLPADQRRFDAQEGSVGGDGGDPGHTRGGDLVTFAWVAPKRARGQKANWSTKAKTRAYLIAESCVKQLVKPCAKSDGAKWATHTDTCQCSPYRVLYDRRREHTATTRPDWTDAHSHNDALRIVAKAILKDLWRAAKAWHESQAH